MAIYPNVQPIFLKEIGLLTSLKLTNQATSRDGQTGTVQVWWDADLNSGANGAFVETIQIEPIGVNVASVLYLYYSLDSVTPTEWRIFHTIPVPACTAVSATGDVSPAATFPVEISTHTSDKRLRLPTVWSPSANDPLNPVRGLRLNPSGVKWGAGLGTAIAGGVIVSFFGGKY